MSEFFVKFQENAFENVVWEMPAILSRGRWVKTMYIMEGKFDGENLVAAIPTFRPSGVVIYVFWPNYLQGFIVSLLATSRWLMVINTAWNQMDLVIR